MRAKTQSVNRLAGYEIPSVASPNIRSSSRVRDRISNGIANSNPSQTAVAANSGDHPLLLKFLTQQQVVHIAEFQQTLDSPGYEPSNRFLVRNRGEIVAHIRVIPRELRFGRSTLSTYHLSELAMLPEYRQAGCMRMLLAAARQKAAANRIALITADSKRPEILRRMGWAIITTGTNVTTSPHSLLSTLEELDATSPNMRWKDKYEIRPLRFVDQPAMAEMYEASSRLHVGMRKRTHEDWLWLMGRRGFNRSFVAIRKATNSSPEKVVGYCLLRDNQVVELISDRDHALSMLALLRRACADVVERGVHSIVILADSAPDLALEGFRSVDIPSSLAACVPSAYDFLKPMKAELGARALANGAKPETKIGFSSGTETVSLEVTKAKLKLKRNEQVNSRIQVSPSMMTRLALGSIDLSHIHDAEDISSTTKGAIEAAQAIFSSNRFLQMPLENLATMEY
ncbi:MAG: GNAT family N-acetyltransferase [Planctomycetales bacterium]|nr:GNAT family N-acetyltransferase [Planctomycetales bacterium]